MPKPENWRLSENQHLERDLGLSSLDRIELFAGLQEQGVAELDETTFARFSTIGDIADWLKKSSRSEEERIDPPQATTPRWTRWLVFRSLRNATHSGIVVPLFRRLSNLNTVGLEHLDKVDPPVVFAANHCSNLDTIAILAALPYQWRGRLAPAIRQEYFEAHFRPEAFSVKRRARSSFEFYLAGALFNTFPIPQKMEGVQKALRYAGELVEAGYCPLIFPEGGRSPDGNLRPFMPGVGVLASRLEVPVIPIHLDGLFEILPRYESWPKAGTCTVRIGTPLLLDRRTDFKTATQRVEDAVHRLAAGVQNEDAD
jgi:long-chain acyl-CoA synthetase